MIVDNDEKRAMRLYAQPPTKTTTTFGRPNLEYEISPLFREPEVGAGKHFRRNSLVSSVFKMCSCTHQLDELELKLSLVKARRRQVLIQTFACSSLMQISIHSYVHL